MYLLKAMSTSHADHVDSNKQEKPNKLNWASLNVTPCVKMIQIDKGASGFIQE